MAFIYGNNIAVSIDNNLLGYSNDASIEITAELLKVTDTINGQFAAFTGAGVSGTMTTAGFARVDTQYGIKDIAALILNLTKVNVKFTIQDMDNNQAYFQAEGFITSLTGNGTVFGLMDSGLTIQLSGIISIN